MKPETTDDIFDIMQYYAPSAALNAAMELGLFWLLADRRMSVENIAQELDIPVNRTHYWLQLLCSLDLIEGDTGGYNPTRTAHKIIVDAHSQATWAFLASEARERFPAVQNLTHNIHLRESAWAVQGLKPPDYFEQMLDNPDRARRFTRMLYEIHAPLAEKIADALDMTGVSRLMDLGGGSGVNSLALLRRNPQLTAMVMDINHVCAAGREIAGENSMEDRISYHAADYLRDELPTGFDMILFCDAGPYSVEFFEKLKAVLKPGGRLVIADQFASPDGVPPYTWLYWAFLASLENPDFNLLSVADVQERLKQAGYQLLSERLLPISEDQRWSNDWTLIEAAPGI
jgi:cyclopropane fatty-acyl-phospholipid synthase-like methyltransferase